MKNNKNTKSVDTNKTTNDTVSEAGPTINVPPVLSDESTDTLPRRKNKFIEMLTARCSDIKASRAANLALAAQTAQSQLVNALQMEYTQLKMAIDAHTDLAPSSAIQLKLDNFDSKEWVEKLQMLKQQAYEKEIDLRLAEETYREFFM